MIRLYMMAWKALSLMYRGRWSEAAGVALSVMNRRRSGMTPFSYIVALVVLGRIRARRGDPEATVILNEALKLASQTGTLQRLGPVRAARAEVAWLAGDQDGVLKETQAVFDLALKQEHVWHIGELSYWQWKAGALDVSSLLLAKPFALQISGDWREAACEWQRLNCPYEAARALAESDDEAALKQALQIFESLGARPATTATAKRLRELGAKGIPRGPRPTTLANPAQLTQRELEVLELLAEGRSNAAISAELVRSPKTVGHHVSAVLAKLGAQNRTEAVRKATDLGILAPK
jgi:DNA-binding CsgD family transcriptional regulator